MSITWLGLYLALVLHRPYHAVTIANIPQNPHTHIEVTGWVTYVVHEADGDLHIRLCDDKTLRLMNRQHCIVAEVIPSLQVTFPAMLPTLRLLGLHLRVRGIFRYDRESNHKWYECHPVEEMAVVP